MTKLLLIRHATNDYVKTARLAGWTAGIHLNEEGKAQAAALGERLASASLTAVYSSPLERTVETAQAVAAPHDLAVQTDKDLGEVDFGEWTGKKLRQLRRKRLWQVIQYYPSGARFPGGASIRETQARVVGALERIAAQHPKGQVAVVAHSDVLKLALAHFTGMPLDMYQRLVIDTASLSVVWLGQMGPRLVLMNDTSHLLRDPQAKQAHRDEAQAHHS